MKEILIVDYITGGGFAEEDLPLDRLAEGYAILRASIEQFAQLGYKIATLIDHRLMQHIRISPIHEFKSVSTHEEFLSGIKAFTDQVDYTLTLAPETKGILKDLASLSKSSKSLYLGSKPESIEKAADKLQTMNLALELGMDVPATVAPNCNDPFEEIAEQVEMLGYPLIVKPIDGIGCQGLTKVNRMDNLLYGLQAASAVSGMDNCIVQEFIPGTPISTSLLANGENVYPLTINHQNLRMDSTKKIGHYLGGAVPYEVPEKYREEIINVSVELVKHLDLTGFVGVDLIVGDEGVFVIEVNPRITVPFIGINNITSTSLAQQLIDVVETGKMTKKISTHSYATFSKIAVPSVINKIARFEKVVGIDGVLSPPFPIGNNSHSYVLLMGIGSSMNTARKNFQRVKNEVLSNLS
ncbi:MAG: ATP-grasp domain-containing protein [Asgard group archaeon]|nr:ATP-grasp domain-containing protein [Asgard group archaeon]